MKKYLFAVLMAAALIASMTVVSLAGPKDPLGSTPICPFTPNSISLSAESVDWEGELSE